VSALCRQNRLIFGISPNESPPSSGGAVYGRSIGDFRRGSPGPHRGIVSRETIAEALACAPIIATVPSTSRRSPELAHLAARSAPRTPSPFNVPNGGWRSPVEAAILKGQGVRPGVPDLIVIKDGLPCGLDGFLPVELVRKQYRGTRERPLSWRPLFPSYVARCDIDGVQGPQPLLPAAIPDEIIETIRGRRVRSHPSGTIHRRRSGALNRTVRRYGRQDQIGPPTSAPGSARRADRAAVPRRCAG
jgi:hypothetical protein